ncbi:hypothetical protein [Parerythrobacter lacustris]|uniref:DUF2007 domain-containing protein n=1 Tax=Parerythrobacter lacustris TaxID=2969984 RepID=A0ABT1XS77_9SPHN|nr:hypothetical protein [Parerythrobacter lacustris]MCR2834462.1 hypothetical protein [Parerythrobacter lacustris]
MTGSAADDCLALVAIVVSRVEAAVLVSMIEANGIHVHIGGFWHASVEVNSLALGGHRLYVAAGEHAAASELLREAGVEASWSFSYGARRAVLRFLALPLSIAGLTIGAGIAAGALPFWVLLQVPFAVLGVPVNPQGRPDYFLSPKPA